MGPWRVEPARGAVLLSPRAKMRHHTPTPLVGIAPPYSPSRYRTPSSVGIKLGSLRILRSPRPSWNRSLKPCAIAPPPGVRLRGRGGVRVRSRVVVDAVRPPRLRPGVHHGARYARHARGWYVYGVRTARRPRRRTCQHKALPSSSRTQKEKPAATPRTRAWAPSPRHRGATSACATLR